MDNDTIGYYAPEPLDTLSTPAVKRRITGNIASIDPRPIVEDIVNIFAKYGAPICSTDIVFPAVKERMLEQRVRFTHLASK